ncbi:MAG: hypothetical protein AAF235_07160, partial [Planctomycetota bacterium]
IPSLAGDLYVGYRSTPVPYRRFVQLIAPLLVLSMVTTASLLSREQPAWGDGVWDTASAKTFEGTVQLVPYPMLTVVSVDGVESDAGPYLLVRPGKLGASADAAPFDGSAVSVTGYLLEREGRRIIELDTAAEAPIVARADAAVTLTQPAWSSPALVTFTGEILDSKCYIGAMKPGEGRGHKACAITCVSGGIPPMIVTLDADGNRRYTLLTLASGEAITGSDLETMLPLIADPTTVTGRSGALGDWGLLAIDPASGIARSPRVR